MPIPALNPIEPTRIDNILQIDEMRIDVPQRALPWTKLYKCTNCLVHHNTIRTRGVFTTPTPASLGDTIVVAAAFKTSAGTTFYVVKVTAAGGTFYGVDTSGNLTSSLGPMTSSTRIPKFVEFNGVLYCTDDLTTTAVLYTTRLGKFYWNGSAFVAAYSGVTSPAHRAGANEWTGNQPAESGAGTTPPNGTYYYVYSYRNTVSNNIVESNYGTVSTAVTTVATRNISVPLYHPSTAANERIDKIRLYRSTSATGPFLYVDDITNLSDNAYHTYADAVTTPNPLIVADNVRHFPVSFSVVDMFPFKQRMWYMQLNSNRLFYSEANEPEHLTYSYLDIGEPNDYNISGLQYDTYAVIIKQRSIWVLEGDDPSSYRTYKIYDEGASSEFSVRKINDYIYFQNEFGFNRVRPGSLGGIERIDDSINPAIDGSISIGSNTIVQPDTIHNKVWLMHHTGAYQVNGAVDYAWVFDPETKKIVGKFTFTNAKWIFFFNGSLYAAITVGGQIFIYVYSLTTTDANAQTFDVEIETGYRFHSPLLANHQRQIKILQDKNSSNEAWTVKANSDGTLSSALGTFTGADSGTPTFKSDKGDKFIAINLSATGIKKVMNIAGFEIIYEPTVIE